MKNKILLILFITLFLVECSAKDDDPPCESFSAPAPCAWAIEEMAYMNMPRPADSYNFPVCIGTDEWFTREVREKFLSNPGMCT